MKNEHNITGRMEIGGDGAGEFSADAIEKRALELCKIEGRETVTEADRERAQAELTGAAETTVAPEAVTPEIEELVAWDDAPDASGHRAERGAFEEEENIGELLVREGVEEAEHQLRVSAVDEQDAETKTDLDN